MNINSRNLLIIKCIFLFELIAVLIFSLFNIGKVFASEKAFTLTNALIIEKTEGVTANVSSFNDDSINSDIEFHRLNDYVIYKLTITNNSSEDYNINTIFDNNKDSNILYEYESNQNIEFKSKTSKDILLKVIYNKELSDINKRIKNNEFKLSFSLVDKDGKEVPEDIIINPTTMDTIIIYIVLAIISLLALLIIFIKKRKANKLLLLALLLTPFITKALSESIIISFNNSIKIYDKLLVTYNVNGKDVTKVIGYNEQLEKPEDPIKKGYIFKGWYNGNELYDFNSYVTGDINLEARYEIINYSISYNLDGGLLEPGKTNPTKYTVEDEILLFNPVKTGYTFSGWTGSNGDTLQTRVTIEKGSIGDKNYTANYSENEEVTYKVIHKYRKLESEEFDVEVEELTGAADTEVQAPLKYKTGFVNPSVKNIIITSDGKAETYYEYEREKYEFKIEDRTNIDSTSTPNGIYEYGKIITVKANNYGHYKFEKWSNNSTNNPLTITLSSNLEIYPIYSLNEYTVTFNSIYGTVSPTTITRGTGEEIGELPIPTPFSGYTFINWYTSATGGSVITSSYIINEDTVIFARYYRNIQGGEITPTSINILLGDSETISIDDVEEPYSFRSNNTEVVTVNENGVVTSRGVGETTITITGLTSGLTVDIDVTVGLSIYNISYNFNGGSSGEYIPTTGTRDNVIRISNPTKTGYDFIGWTSNVGENAESGISNNSLIAWNGSLTTNTYFKNLVGTGTVTMVANWAYTAIPSITLVDYNTFTVSAPSASKYFISSIQSTAPSADASGWTVDNSSGDLTLDENQTWYVWVQDADGNVSPNNSTITTKTVTQSKGTGTSFKMKNGSSSGETIRIVSNIANVLDGTTVYVTASADTGYESLVFKKDDLTISSGSTHIIDSNVTFTTSATEMTATLSYNANGHGTAPNSVEMKYTTSTNAAEEISANGYTFVEWNTKKDGTGKGYSVGEEVNGENEIPSNITLYAQWTYSETPSITLVDYNTFIVSGTGANKYFISNTQSTKPAANLEGWTTSSSSGDLTLAASQTWYVWIQDADGKVSDNNASIITRTIKQTIGTGTTFNMYNDSSKEKEIKFNSNNRAYVLKGSSVYVTGTASTGYESFELKKGSTRLENDEATVVITSTTTFTTSATEMTATLSYNANGHGTAPNSVEMKYTTSTTVVEPIGENGYTFIEWNTKADGTGTKYIPGQEVNGENEIPSAITLYAQWTYGATPSITLVDYNTFTVSGISANKYFISNTQSTKPAADLEGWSTSSSSGDLTLSASQRWYVWIQDAAGNVSDNNSSIITRTITKSIVTGTAFNMYNDSSKTDEIGFNSNNKAYILNGTTVYVTASVNTGYENFVFKKGSSNIESETSYKITSNTTFTTIATEKKAKLKYEGNSCGTAPAAVDMYFTTSTNAASAMSSLAVGHTFTGWNTQADGNGTPYAPSAEVNAANVEPVDITLYAQCTYDATPTITVENYNSFVIDAVGASKYYVSTQNQVPTISSECWTTDSIASDLQLTEGSTYYVWVQDGSNKISPNSTSIDARTITRSVGTGTTFKIYDENEDEIKFTSNKANVLNGASVYIVGGLKTGYKDLVVKKEDNIIDNETTHKIISNTTFTTSATEKTATLRYEGNSCGTAPADVVMKYTTATNAATSMVSVNSGYTFVGWEDDDGNTYDPGEQVKGAKVIPKDITLNAQCTYSTTPVITRVDYDTFSVSAVSGSQFIISKTIKTKPDVNDSNWSLTSTQDVNTNAKEKWYVWVKDSDNIVSDKYATITNYKITLDQGVGTELKAYADSLSGSEINTNTYVLKGTTVYVKVNPLPGYDSDTIKLYKGTDLIENESGHAIKAATTFVSSTNPSTYTVTYYLGDLNGDDTELGTTTCTFGTDCELTSFSTLGGIFPYGSGDTAHANRYWTFYGWGTSNNTTTKSYNNGGTINISTYTSNVNLYAIGKHLLRFYSGVKPTKDAYTSKYQYWNPHSTADSYRTTVEIPSSAAITGWTFKGYRVASNTVDGNVTYSSNTVGTTVRPVINNSGYYRSVYERTLTVNYNSNGGTGTTASTTLIQYYNSGYNNEDNISSNSIMLASNEFTKDGYNFTKWAEGSTSGTQYAAGVSYTGIGTSQSDTNISVNMYAIWSEKTATLTYNDNGCGTAPDDVIMRFSTATNAASEMSSQAVDYTFTGWNTQSDGEGIAYEAGQEVNAVDKEPADTTLYAQCTYNPNVGISLDSTSYNKLNISPIVDNNKYLITTSSDKPTKDTPGWSGDNTTQELQLSYGKTYYAWIQDSEGRISTNFASIGVKKITKDVGTETSFSLKYKKSNGADLTLKFNDYNELIVFDRTKVYVTASANTGYTDLVFTKDDSPISSESTHTITSNTTFKTSATEKTATLRYDENGHGIAPDPVTMRFTEATLAAEAISEEGYTFNGWSDGKGKTYGAGQEVKAENAEPTEMTLTAQWTYTATPSITLVDYNTFTVSGTSANKYFISNTQSTKPAANENGWTRTLSSGNLLLEANQTWYVWIQDEDGNVSSNNATITTKTITQDKGIGTTLKMQNKDSKGTTIYFTSNKAYVFDGTTVYVIASANKGYENLIFTKDGSLIDGNGATYEITSDTTFKTSATEKTAKLHYDENGHGTAPDDVDMYFTKATIAAAAISANGYEFTGWSDGNGNTYEPGQQVKKANVEPTEMTLTAQWTKTTYEIEYNLNDGTVSTENRTSYDIETETFTLNNPTKTGYTFKGWSGTGLTGDTNQTVTVSKGSTGNRTYTANWEVLKTATIGECLYPKYEGTSKKLPLIEDGEGVVYGIQDGAKNIEVDENNKIVSNVIGEYNIIVSLKDGYKWSDDDAKNTDENNRIAVTCSVNMTSNNNPVEAYFIDMSENKNANQTILLVTRQGKTILIDTSDNSNADKIIYYYLKQFQYDLYNTEVKIDYLFISHPHGDHIRGLGYIANRASSIYKINIGNLYYKTTSADDVKHDGLSMNDAITNLRNARIVDSFIEVNDKKEEKENEGYTITIDTIKLHLYNLLDVFNGKYCPTTKYLPNALLNETSSSNQNNNIYINRIQTVAFTHALNDNNKKYITKEYKGNTYYYYVDLKNESNKIRRGTENEIETYTRNNDVDIWYAYVKDLNLDHVCNQNANSIAILVETKTTETSKYIYIPSDIENNGYTPFKDTQTTESIYGPNGGNFLIDVNANTGENRFIFSLDYAYGINTKVAAETETANKIKSYIGESNLNNLLIYQQSHHGYNNAYDVIDTLSLNRNGLYTIMNKYTDPDFPIETSSVFSINKSFVDLANSKLRITGASDHGTPGDQSTNYSTVNSIRCYIDTKGIAKCDGKCRDENNCPEDGNPTISVSVQSNSLTASNILYNNQLTHIQCGDVQCALDAISNMISE